MKSDTFSLLHTCSSHSSDDWRTCAACQLDLSSFYDDLEADFERKQLSPSEAAMLADLEARESAFGVCDGSSFLGAFGA